MTDQERDPEATGPEGAADPEAAADAVAAPDAVDAAAEAAPEPEDMPVDEAVAGTTAETASRRKDRTQGKGTPAKGQPAVAPSVAQEAVHVQDRASAVFVIAIVGVFVAILAYGLLFGHGGLVSGALATPKPVPTVPASVAPSAAPSVAPSAAPSVAPSVSAAPSVSVAPSAAPSSSAAPSAAPSAPPSAAPASPSPAAS